MSYYVMPTTQARRSRWERLLGQDMLPVLNGEPRVAEGRSGSRLVYDLALDELHPMQVRRIAAWVARGQRVGYSQALRWIQTRGVWVEADGVVVVETADEPGAYRPFRVFRYGTSSVKKLVRRGGLYPSYAAAGV